MITRSAAAAGRRWLAADCALTAYSEATCSGGSCDPADLEWDSKHQLWSWPHPGPSPALARSYPEFHDPLCITVAEPKETRIAVGSFFGFVRSAYIACAGQGRTRDIVGLYDCDSRPGDCGSLVMSRSGVVGLHAGTLTFEGVKYNAFYPFVLGHSAPFVSSAKCESEVRHSGRMTGGGGGSRPNQSRPPSASSVRIVQTRPAPVTSAKKHDDRPHREGSSQVVAKPRPRREAGIVGMGPAPSSLPGRNHSSAFTVSRYVDVLMNPWASPYLRLPDRVVVPTSLARFVKNSTFTIKNTTTNGTNLVFAMHNRLSCAQNSAAEPIEAASVFTTVGPAVSAGKPYSYGPGSVLSPLQWGAGPYVDPVISMSYTDYVPPLTAFSGVWGDDFGTSMRTSLPYMAAYRTTAMALRCRIVGLPTGQFMTPGKIYFAQVRYDHSDLPITEQDFATLEQLNRATHVSADAVRAAGSKTLFYTPDGEQKFSMVSTFLPACGVFDAAELTAGLVNQQGAGYRTFPTPAVGTTPLDFTRNIIPYRSVGCSSDPAVTATAFIGSGSGADAANADSTTILIMAYFGAADGVVLEVDYAHIVEYIPTKSSPGGVEALVQLPDSNAMDEIFAAAAVLAEAKPVMLQQAGDLTLTASARGTQPASREAISARNRLSTMARGLRGGQYREGFWDFDWLKKGSLGDGAISWDFAGGGGKRR